ncbi:hypothetical protein E4T66_17385 [Sinimarinibacterium sp. CAU 1509]|uniref:hypothetical protein n=1 Tax=Sinimarinibacterium sp. CAU 1509 TaxID=2562283 RepID=UPI0010AD0A46|nr:hypothetical protein [Sinimarinibacterium sp. CAU 1509]TJY57184.1 hypothetical protein E4T66_17385 [Sinimarinibacterium sp. CAU 1509]
MSSLSSVAEPTLTSDTSSSRRKPIPAPEQLALQFRGGHPDHPREAWLDDCEGGFTDSGYWEWVREALERCGGDVPDVGDGGKAAHDEQHSALLATLRGQYSTADYPSALRSLIAEAQAEQLRALRKKMASLAPAVLSPGGLAVWIDCEIAVEAYNVVSADFTVGVSNVGLRSHESRDEFYVDPGAADDVLDLMGVDSAIPDVSEHVSDFLFDLMAYAELVRDISDTNLEGSFTLTPDGLIPVKGVAGQAPQAL